MFWLLMHCISHDFVPNEYMHLKKLKRARQFARAGRTNPGRKQLGTPGWIGRNLTQIIEQATDED